MAAISHYPNSTAKRLFDILLALTIAIVTSPLLFLVGIIVLLTAGWPIFFIQPRLGKAKQTFLIYKFRTMYNGAQKDQPQFKALNQAPSPMFKATNDPRFVGIGKLLSRSGLDELPQFINILKGEMSFVGPRPLPVLEAKKLDSSWNFRYQVRPGIFSYWSLASNRYKDLQTWKYLDKKTLAINSLTSEIKVIASVVIRLIFSFFNHRHLSLVVKNK